MIRFLIFIVLAVLLYHLVLSGCNSFRYWELSLLDLSSFDKEDRVVYLIFLVLYLGFSIFLYIDKDGFRSRYTVRKLYKSTPSKDCSGDNYTYIDCSSEEYDND